MKTTRLIIDSELDTNKEDRDQLYHYCLDNIEQSRKFWGTFQIMNIINCEYYWFLNSRGKQCLLITKSSNFYEKEKRTEYLYQRNLKLSHSKKINQS